MSHKPTASDIIKRVLIMGLFIAQAILIILKTTTVINWAWWIVCIPNYLALSVLVNVWIMRKVKRIIRLIKLKNRKV